MSYAPTPAQDKAADLLAGTATHVLLRGGARSGKSFEATRTTAVRGLLAPGSSHVILRQKFNHLKPSIILDTMPKVLKLCYPELPFYDSMLNKTDWLLELPNKSRIWFGGLDDKERTEKILGQEHATIQMEEVSQISYASRNKAVTRLAQNCGLKLLAMYTMNPPKISHWTYRMFIKKQEPDSGTPLARPDNYVTIKMNPADNPHLAAQYLAELDDLTAKDRKRFRDGDFLPQVDGALWTLEDRVEADGKRVPGIDSLRVAKGQLPSMRRITINIDPSGCSGEEDVRSDEIGLTATGLGVNNHGYLLEDASGHYSPEQWARKAVEMFDRHEADCVIGEKNYGGDMVRATVHAHRSHVPFKLVTATRGKVVRAEPISALYDKGVVHHVGTFVDLEDQLCEFSTAGYGGDTSPDRADSMIWGFTELMTGVQVQAGMLLSSRNRAAA